MKVAASECGQRVIFNSKATKGKQTPNAQRPTLNVQLRHMASEIAAEECNRGFNKASSLCWYQFDFDLATERARTLLYVGRGLGVMSANFGDGVWFPASLFPEGDR